MKFYTVFDPIEYVRQGSRDIGNNKRCWKKCTILRIYNKGVHPLAEIGVEDIEYPLLYDVVIYDREGYPERISCGHLPHAFKEF